MIRISGVIPQSRSECRDLLTVASHLVGRVDPDTRSLRSLLRDDSRRSLLRDDSRRSLLRDDRPRPYADPYLTGVVLGLVLLTAFVLVGRGLGASGAFSTVAASAVNVVSPSAVQSNSFFADRLVSGGAGLWTDWLVVEIAGVFVGGWASAVLARRFRLTVERGAGVSVTHRLGLATIGGSVMGVGAVLARGCTSGQALTGGALLSVGSWIFIGGAFAAAYAAAWLMRGEWT
jgi:uncharacterized membrane protein YedE/YeeE